MKRIAWLAISGAWLLAVSPTVRAQDCSGWNNWDLRGTYTMSGSGWADLSKLLPGSGLPSGLVPMSWVGAHVWDGAGGGSGWISLNAAGNQMNAQFVGLKYSISSDCSIQVSFSLKVKELGITIGPIPRLMVPSGARLDMGRNAEALELHMIVQGTAPGAPTGPGLDLGVSHRISMQNY
jgi:hypothetical protein